MQKFISKKILTGLFTLLLCTGIFIPGCEDSPGELTLCNCDAYKYFDVQDIVVKAFGDLDNREEIPADASINFPEFVGFYVEYIVDYHAYTAPVQENNWSFSLMNKAYACSCIGGAAGSKDEKLTSFSITTVNDFDEDHKAGDSLVDLFNYKDNSFSTDEIPLADFLANNTNERLTIQGMFLTLSKAPSLNTNFQVKVKFELSTGEVYEVESEAFELLP